MHTFDSDALQIRLKNISCTLYKKADSHWDGELVASFNESSAGHVHRQASGFGFFIAIWAQYVYEGYHHLRIYR